MTLAYFDCFSGISGDMLLGALLDLGFALSDLEAGLGSLPLGAFDLMVTREQRMHLTGNRFQVGMSGQHQESRSFKDIHTLINSSPLPLLVKKNSIQAFKCLAQAEARIHDQPLNEVHFHEIGAIDSIIDIVGAMLGIYYLGIDNIVSSPLPLGSGFIATRHGTIPVPAPATVEILKGVPVRGTELPHELVTPTGAAILATVVRGYGPLPAMNIKRIGYGVGTRDYRQQPNMLRIILGTQTEEVAQGTLCTIESNIDNMNPELYDHVMDVLFKRGALDVCMIPVHMKKNRPGIILKIIAREMDKAALVRTLFEETSTTGVRFYGIERQTLVRRIETATTPWGEVRVKVITDPDGHEEITPEYEDCRTIAREQNLPLKTVYRDVLKSLTGK